MFTNPSVQSTIEEFSEKCEFNGFGMISLLLLFEVGVFFILNPKLYLRFPFFPNAIKLNVFN